MKKFSFILLFVFLLQLVTIVEAKEIDTNNPIEVACDFACYYDPEYAVGFNIDNSTVVMEDSKYVAVSISNVKPIGAGLIVVLEKSSNNVVCTFYCQDYWDDMIYEKIAGDNPNSYKEYNENYKGKNYYTNLSIENAYRYLVDNPMGYDGLYTVYDMDGDGVKEFIYYDWYDSSDPNAIYSIAYHYNNGKLYETEISYDNYVKNILNKTQWCKLNDNSLIDEVYGNNISVVLNGNEISFEQPPYIENGATRVPMRKIFESLGATVDYNADTKTITAKKDNTVIELVTGASTAKIDGKETPLTASVENKNGSTMVPLRFVSEALGADVLWDGENKIITINLAEK